MVHEVAGGWLGVKLDQGQELGLVDKAYCLDKSKDLETNYEDKLSAENRAELLDNLDINALAKAREADEFGNWGYLADSISDAGVFFCFGEEALQEMPEQEDPLADYIRSTGNLQDSFHGGPP